MFYNSILEIRVLQICLCFLWEFEFIAGTGIQPCRNQKQHSTNEKKKYKLRGYKIAVKCMIYQPWTMREYMSEYKKLDLQYF